MRYLIIFFFLLSSVNYAATLTAGFNCDYATIQEAVDAAVSGDTLHVSAEIFTGASATVNITNKSLIINGGYADNCSTYVETYKSILDAQGEGDSVFEITDTNGGLTVYISGFSLINGEDDFDNGGGIEFSGNASEPIIAILSDVEIKDNDSSYGGGIHMTDTDLLLIGDTKIYSNQGLLDGGGIYCEDGDITLSNADIGVAFGNLAGFNGGGLFLDNCDLTLKGETGINSSYVRINESGKKGGGIYAENDSRIDLQGDLAVIYGNYAGTSGGGLALFGGSQLYSDNGQVINNGAFASGGGFYVSGQNSLFDMDRDSNYSCVSKCNQLSFNSAHTGAAGYVDTGAKLDMKSSWIEGNRSTDGAMAFYSGGTINLIGSMIINQKSVVDANELFNISAGATTIKYCTIAGTQIVNGSSASLFNLHTDVLASLSITDSIVWWNDLLYINLVTTDFGQSVSLARNILEFNEGGSNLVADPLFVAPGTDYHILSNSPAVDFAAPTASVDIDKETRDLGSSSDAGADEAYTIDIIFMNDFE